MSRSMVVFIKKRRVVFDTPYDDASALAKLREYVRSGHIRSSFAQSLAARRSYSSAQMAWVHKLVVDSEGESIGSTRPAFDFPKVFRG
jgi:hypothetical protein